MTENSGFRSARKALGLTQSELAACLGVSSKTIRRAEARVEVAPLWRFALRGLAIELSLDRLGKLTLERRKALDP